MSQIERLSQIGREEEMVRDHLLAEMEDEAGLAPGIPYDTSVYRFPEVTAVELMEDVDTISWAGPLRYYKAWSVLDGSWSFYVVVVTSGRDVETKDVQEL